MTPAVKSWTEALTSRVYERQDEVRLLLVALVAQEHIVLFGDPGTAKSMLARTLCDMMPEGRLFEYLLTRYTQPDEVLGPFSLKGLENDRFERVTDGYLPTAQVAFLDEVFRANSALLNCLLAILNERLYFECGQRHPVPLEIAICAANDLPDLEDGSLAALYDRFLFRRMVRPIAEHGSFSRMLKGSASKPDTTIAREALTELRTAATLAEIDDGSIGVLIGLKATLETKYEIVASDRRWFKSVKALKAACALRGGTKVDLQQDADILADILWTDPAQRPAILKELKKFPKANTAASVLSLDLSALARDSGAWAGLTDAAKRFIPSAGLYDPAAVLAARASMRNHYDQLIREKHEQIAQAKDITETDRTILRAGWKALSQRLFG